MTSLTCLVPVYHGTRSSQLDQTLTSLLTQTRPAEEVVIIIDGPIDDSVRASIGAFIDDYAALGAHARTVTLETNSGAGIAMQAGMQTVTTPFVAKLDSDDAAAPSRFEKQLQAFANVPDDIAAIGSAVAEFENTPGDRDTIRRLPSSPEAIARYAKVNSPINHPSVMMRTAVVEEVGGYRDVFQMEDYDLFARMLAAGYRLLNLPEPLTFFRVSSEQFSRRSAPGMFRAEVGMQRSLIRLGLVSYPRAAVNLAVRSLYRALPRQALLPLYRILFNRERKT